MNSRPHNQMLDYGWSSEKQVCSNAYLENPVISTCRSLAVSNVLDLGCGRGDMANALARSGFNVIGCDADAEGIRIARASCPQATFHHIGVYDDPGLLGKHDFDAVISTEVVEHLYVPRALPRFAAEVLKDGGWFIITTPYHGYLKNLAIALSGHWDRHVSPLWDGGHIKFFSRRTLTELMEEVGFQVVRFEGLGRVPYLWKSMMLVAKKLPGK